MRGDTHVRFGGRVRETDPGQPGHRARVRPNSGGCWRTLQGLTDFAIVQSYLDTATKWGLDKLDALRQLFTTGAWLPPTLKPAE